MAQIFYNSNFQFDEINMVKMTENKVDDIHHDIPECRLNNASSYIEPCKQENRKKRRNLSNSFLRKLAKNFQNLTKLQNTKIGITEQNENEMVEVVSDDDSCNYTMMPSSRTIPVCELKHVSKVTIRTKQGNKFQELNHYHNFQGRNKKATFASSTWEDDSLYMQECVYETKKTK